VLSLKLSNPLIEDNAEIAQQLKEEQAQQGQD
jgi:hypothetical protein